MLNLKKLEEFKKFETEIHEAATKILDDINSIKPIDGYKFLDVESFDSSDVYFSGEEIWQYGGYEKYTYSIPTELIFNNKLKNQFLQKLKEEVNVEKIKESERRKKSEDEALEKKRKQYEELKQEFESK